MPQTPATVDPELHECVISIGSNIKPEYHYACAIEILEAECDLVARTAPILTTPVGFQAQPDFLNSAILIRTGLNQTDFKNYLKQVEDRLGRVRGPIKSGPRTMDLDIVAWDGHVVDEGYHQHDYVRDPVDALMAEAGRKLA